MSALPAPIEVFYSYADADELFCIELEKHLSLLLRDGIIVAFHKRLISAGTNTSETIDEHLNTASIILLLISVDFVSSDYCYGIEMQRAMQRHHAGEARVIPLLLRPVDNWQGTPFGKLQVLPGNGKPVISWPNQDDAFVTLAKGIRAALQGIQPFAGSTPSTTLPRLWNIPYPRNPFFTGRDELFTRLGNYTALQRQLETDGTSS